ncbi:MAG: phage terminase large subunit [Hyphomicrobiaceae bacterium]|jgi:phage terminase large subunit
MAMLWPPDLHGEMQRRIRLTRMLSGNQKMLAAAIKRYTIDPAAFIEDCCYFSEPRNANKELPVTIPVVLFDRQREFVEWLHQRYQTQTSGPVMKTRDAGATYICSAFSVWLWLFHPGATIGWGSRKQDLIDRRGDPSSIFQKMRDIIEKLPPYLIPDGYNSDVHANFMRITNPVTGSAITGEAGDNCGRGMRNSIYFLDEAAFMERPHLVDAALSATTDVRIDISSVKAGTPFMVTCSTSQNVFTFDWQQIPWLTKELMAKKRAEAESKGMLASFKAEYLRDASAAVEGALINSDWIEASIDSLEKLGLEPTGDIVGALDVADGGRDKSAIAVRYGTHLTDLASRGDCRADEAAQWAWRIANQWHCGRLMYDAIGVGAGAGGAFRTIKETQTGGPACHGWAGSGEVIDPYSIYAGDRANRDMFANRKAQAWWSLRDRFENTFRLINGDKTIDPDSIISLDSKLPELEQLKQELTQVTYKDNSAGRVVIDKAPEGHRSPNLADAATMAYGPVLDTERTLAFAIVRGAAAA